jgi:hypothetical protein
LQHEHASVRQSDVGVRLHARDPQAAQQATSGRGGGVRIDRVVSHELARRLSADWHSRLTKEAATGRDDSSYRPVAGGNRAAHGHGVAEICVCMCAGRAVQSANSNGSQSIDPPPRRRRCSTANRLRKSCGACSTSRHACKAKAHHQQQRTHAHDTQRTKVGRIEGNEKKEHKVGFGIVVVAADVAVDAGRRRGGGA